MSLKAMLLAALDAVILVAPPGVKALVTLVRWVISTVVPDTIPAPAVPSITAVADAPDGVKTFVRSLFEAAKTYVTGPIYRRLLAAAETLVVDYFLDIVWDAVTGQQQLHTALPPEKAENAEAALKLIVTAQE